VNAPLCHVTTWSLMPFLEGSYARLTSLLYGTLCTLGMDRVRGEAQACGAMQPRCSRQGCLHPLVCSRLHRSCGQTWCERSRTQYPPA